MRLEALPHRFTVCKIADPAAIDFSDAFCFVGKTDRELSLVCRTEVAPEQTISREDGWRGFRVGGTLDFSLVGILSKITGILAENRIGLFAVSTFDTDYLFVKEAQFERALRVLAERGYTVAR